MEAELSKWRKKFAAWQAAKQPVSVDEVETILKKVFGDRLREHEGSSHRWTVDVPELTNAHRDYQFGEIGFPVKNGQKVKGMYLQIAFDAAERLGLPEERNAEGEDEDND